MKFSKKMKGKLFFFRPSELSLTFVFIKIILNGIVKSKSN